MFVYSNIDINTKMCIFISGSRPIPAAHGPLSPPGEVIGGSGGGGTSQTYICKERWTDAVNIGLRG